MGFGLIGVWLGCVVDQGLVLGWISESYKGGIILKCLFGLFRFNKHKDHSCNKLILKGEFCQYCQTLFQRTFLVVL